MTTARYSLRKTAMQRRRISIMFIILASLLGALVWWYWPDPHLVRTIVMDDRVSAVAFSPDGKTLAVGVAHGTIELRAVATGALVRQLSGHTGNVLSVAWSADGQQLVSGAYDGT